MENELENDEGMVAVYDKGMSMAILTELYEYLHGGVYMVNCVNNIVYENLTAEPYMMMIGAVRLWMRRSTRKRMKRRSKSRSS